MMNETMTMIFALLIGGLLGAIYFGGLWLTIQKGVNSNRPEIWFLCSSLLRMSLALVVFYFIGHDDWKSLVVCVLGFFVARLIVKQLICAEGKSDSLSKEVSLAP